ncbi:outer membrane channel lipoprotein [Geotalea uraniireducens]|uniref:Outer membrane channel lipoprotein n=1 Tax=Geotalea uraniireducens TaxID=351604 RepID=A0ABM8EK88_9BACT|nr:hypothetical protein [Geotalea uraniireducens]BDV42835.1 outer membrane channel lipoprotein [Geotalea uraniireducens]
MRPLRFAMKLTLTAFVLFVTVSGVIAAEAAPADDNEELSGAQPENVIEPFNDAVELPFDEVEVETHRWLEVPVGYRFMSVEGYGGRAAEYEYLHSSFTGGAQLGSLGKDFKLVLDGAYANAKDYNAQLVADYKGYYRLNVRTESLYHNLDHERLNHPLFSDQNPTDTYGIAVRQDSVNFRYKLHDYPIHLNLGHWLLVRSGNSQLRYADYAFDGAAGNALHSRSNRVDRRIHEGTAGFDAHLGPVNLVYTFLIRQFDDQVGTPQDNLIERRDPDTGAIVRYGGLQQHNSDPESRFYSHTVKMYTSLSGGIVGAASYSYGKRENRSSLVTVSGTDQSSDTLQNAAGDFTYTPCRWFSVAVKYRHQEVDRNNASTLYTPFAANPVVTVRPSIDTRQDVLSAALSLRPITILTISGEYKGTFLRRDNTGTGAALWQLPGESDTHRGTLTIFSRPFKGFRLRALYGYTAADTPAYDTLPERKHTGQLLASYNSVNRWGLSASYQIVREWNNQISRTATDFNDPTLTATYVLPRDRFNYELATGFWFSPVERLTISGNYAYLRNRAEQALLVSHGEIGGYAGSDFVARSTVCGLNAAYQLTELLELSLALQQVRSLAEYNPDSATANGGSTAGIMELSRVKTVENSLSARAQYSLSQHFSCGVNYTYRDYDNKLATANEGTVHLVIASVKAKW